jgi:hypothetical protein
LNSFSQKFPVTHSPRRRTVLQQSIQPKEFIMKIRKHFRLVSAAVLPNGVVTSRLALGASVGADQHRGH